MNILYIWDADYPWDIRVEKICRSLIDNGHSVHIVARNLKNRAEYDLIDGLHIHRIAFFKVLILNYLLSFPAFFSPIWHHLINEVIYKFKIETIIVRDLPMAIAGIWAAKRWNIPVYFDMAEDYVSMLWNVWKYKRFNPMNFLVRNPLLAYFVEKYAIKRMNHIFIVVDEAISVIARAGGNKQKVSLVSNTPNLHDFENHGTDIPQSNILRMSQKYSIVYCGNILLARGISIMIDSIIHLSKYMNDFQFVVIGDGYALKELQSQVVKRHHESYVWWLGWIEHSSMLQYIKLARIGIIPNYVSRHTNTTIPNKIFDYMACGIPVVASNAIPMKRIIESENCGEVFKSGDSLSLSNAILKVRDSTIDYGSNGRAAIVNKYNWDFDKKRLFDVIESKEDKNL
jgi:glycosyltransferase involved in cell wall biosynthesis